MKDLRRPCPVCEGLSGYVLHSQEFAAPDEFKVEPSFDIVECDVCGMVFADTIVHQDDLDDLYRDHSKYADTSTFASDNRPLGAPGSGESDQEEPAALPPEAPWDLERLDQTATFLSSVVPDRDATILDAGCATGALLGFLKQQGYHALSGLDPSPVATTTARDRYGVNAITGSFVAPPDTLGRFDVITLCHVLEHLSDVGGAITALDHLLEPDGVVYVEVPDAARYADYLVAPFHDFNTEHINHFSTAVLENLMSRHGFECREIRTDTVHCSPHHLYPVVMGIWQRREQGLPAPAAGNDPGLAEGIRAYVSSSAELLAGIDQQLEASIPSDGRVLIWGAGQLTMKLLQDTVLARSNVVALIDSSEQKQGLHFAGIPVISPEEAKQHPEPVVIGSIHHAADIQRALDSSLGPDRKLILLRP